ncbi:tetratricopeptide repeat protein [Humisphaera borealis]|uniref:Tetratricopeptide repeat protein n=1 Tax=Humisphaera borealis TaxID=2807512 RepID=A0A7M2WZA4_9BACT|nr:tetratricopeptide repeat protein [Humisphaera borealis]
MVLAVLACVVFGRGIGNDFVDWDDTTAIVYNPDYNPPSLDKLGHYWTQPFRNFYAPVLYSVWGIAAYAAYDEYVPPDITSVAAAWRLAAEPFHVLSLLAHIGSTVFAFLILSRLFERRMVPAFVGAVVFCVHPLQVEAVGWASTLYTPLSVALGLAAWWTLLAALDRRDKADGSRWKWRYVLATLLFATSLLTKPSMVLMPLIALFAEAIVRRRSRVQIKRSAWLIAPWIALSGAASWIISSYAQPALDVVRPPTLQRLLIAGDALSFYMGKVVWPVGLAPDYGRTPTMVLEGAMPWLGVSICLVVAVMSVVIFRANRAAACGLWIFLIGGLPTLGLVPFDFQLYSTVADRYAYFSLFGIAMVVSAIAARLSYQRSDNLWRWGIVTGGILLTLCVLTIRQLGFWRDSPTLFARCLDINPTSRVGLAGMLAWKSDHKQPDEAIVYGRLAVAHHHGDYRLCHRVAGVLMQLKQWDEAIAMLERAAQLAREPDAKADAVNTQGVAFALSNRPPQAEQRFRAALALQSDLHSAHRNLAALYLSQNRLADALGEFEQALRLDPANPQYRGAVAQLSADLRRMTATPATKPAP